MKKALAFSLLFASGVAAAQQSGFYVGAGVGQGKVSIDNGASDALVNAGATNVSSSKDNTDTSYKIFAGYQINKNFEVEGGYANFGKYKASASGTIAGGPISASGDVKSYAIFLDAVGIAPVTEAFSVFGKAGVAFTDTEANASASGAGVAASASDSARKWVPKLGVGAQFYVSRNVALRAEYEYYFKVGDQNSTGQSDVQVLTAGVTIGF
ncbi:MAG TPA: outer membrane beta-barrel protein [Accumulibacter sp.]|uniref:outer membrane beta-barrel protein n=1 Tax=Accumulibacter sp. TaxID=2053492 RepID=UPI0025D6D078|nr:outer membrane beta-barrel protein [Accumulibacter sp.]MCM8600020.1 outer membrane beta-barrel protein [Accumulibacter sp.]MCM8664207.1 outer membrane beta-barrel protein [Accumulibacter sp.]HNC53164.1 outer membrane beta-barrel protein [Accumulibacter sp.]